MIKTKKELKSFYQDMAVKINELRGIALPYTSGRMNLSDKQVNLMNDIIFSLKKAHESAVMLSSVELSRNEKEQNDNITLVPVNSTSGSPIEVHICPKCGANDWYVDASDNDWLICNACNTNYSNS